MEKMLHLKYILIAFFFAVFLQSCQKAEFMPEPLGEAIPAPEYPDLVEALNTAKYSLFSAAWQRAGMQAILQKERPQGKFTFLVPDNEAMQSAGYSASAIASVDIKKLGEMLRYHVLTEQVSLAQLAATPSDLLISTMLVHARFLEGAKVDAANQETIPYRYRHALIVKGNELLDNGIGIKTGTEISVSAGQVIPVDRVLEIPSKQMVDVLKEDGRFNLLLKAMQISDQLYFNDMSMNYYIGFPAPNDYLIDWDYIIPGTLHTIELKRHVIRFTLFAPTDAAFNKIGIYSEQDLLALNERVPVPWMYDNMSTPVDSLLENQKIGLASAMLDVDWNTMELAVGIQKNSLGNNAVFYTHSLNNQLLANYVIWSAAASYGEDYYVDYDFGKNAAGQVTLKKKGSKYAPVTIIEPNINTVQGPIHVIDDIILSDEFSMWHKK